jgi:hypothetical protein
VKRAEPPPGSSHPLAFLAPVRFPWLFLGLEQLFFGLKPIIEFGARLIAVLDIQFVSATADALF